MVINGIYEKTLYRDEKYGDTVFTVIPDSHEELLGDFGNIVCKGVIPRYPEKTPLELVVSEKDDSFGVWSSRVSSYSEKAVKEFLSTDYFPGIGEAKAENYIKKYGHDIFNEPLHDDFSVVAEKTKNLLSFEKLFELVQNLGGTFHNAYRVYRRYGSDCMDMIKENPYILTEFLSFDMADSYARRLGIDDYDPKRIKCIIREGLRKSESRGNTCTELSDFNRIISDIDKNINPVYLLGSVLMNKDFYLDRENYFVYDSGLYMSEENTAFNIVRLQNNPVFYGKTDESVIKSIEESEGTYFKGEQYDAFGLLERSGVKVITGGPGTGKTTVINGLIKYLKIKRPGIKISLAAPTANAAKRIREKTGEDATTIHRLLEITPFADSDNFGFKDLDSDVVIIDESSFIDTRLSSIILQSLKKDVIIIFVGDVDQLPSVGPGNFFRDLIDSDCIETIRLTQIHRQSEGSLIIENAVKIKNGIVNLETGESFEIKRFSDEDSMFEYAVDLMKNLYKTDKPYSVRLYTPVKKRKYKCCTHSFNKELQNHFSLKEDFFIYGYTKFYVGDPVIFTRNNYNSGYSNGDEGRITSILSDETGKFGVRVLIQDESIDIKGDDLLDMELSFAITTHKSQGAECDTAIVIVPSNPRGMLDRSIIYVATTRARRNTIVLSEGRSLEVAISNDRKCDRKTGLKGLIKQKFIYITNNNNRQSLGES